MAKQNPATDPVSAAMSAIESALNLTDDEIFAPAEDEAAPAASADPAKAKAPGPILKPSAPAPESAPLLRPGSQPAPEADTKPTIAATPPANDDRETVGVILQAMNRSRVNRAPFVAAIAASLAWVALCAVYVYERLWPAVASTTLRETLFRPETPLIALAMLGPILFIFAFAALARRMGELRQSARAISEVAVRLAEPETVAGEHVATLSQAIRRELTSMGDGVERAIARAAELETRVKAEVSTLERSYSDNERKIRSLIAEMADQREAILASGTRVRDAIANAHSGISGDLQSAGDSLSERLNEAGQRLAAALGSTSEEIAISMNRTGSSAVERIAAEGTQIAISIAGVGETLASRLVETSRQTADSIVARVERVDGRIKSAGEILLAGGRDARRRSCRPHQRLADRDRRRDRRARRPGGRADRGHLRTGPQHGRRLYRRPRRPHRRQQRARHRGLPDARKHRRGPSGRDVGGDHGLARGPLQRAGRPSAIERDGDRRGDPRPRRRRHGAAGGIGRRGPRGGPGACGRSRRAHRRRAAPTPSARSLRTATGSPGGWSRRPAR